MTPVPFSNRTTSLEAAHAVDQSGRAHTQAERVLSVLESAGEGGLTDGQIARFANLGERQASTRRRALVLAGKVADSGLVRVYPPPTDDRPRLAAIVWVRRDGPALEPAKQTHGQVAAAVQSERERVLKALRDESALLGMGRLGELLERKTRERLERRVRA
jgi:hypothetical protein